MEHMILSLFSILLFCLCCHQFIKTVVTPVPLMRIERAYARGAMQLGKGYKIMAWGSMTAVFLGSLVISFSEVFTTF